MLENLPEHHKTQWKNHINKLVQGCNCTKHSSAGYYPYYTPYYNTAPHYSTTIEILKEKMKGAYQLVLQNSNDRKTKDVIRRNTNRPCLTGLKCRYETCQSEVEQARWEATGKRRSILLYHILVMTLLLKIWDQNKNLKVKLELFTLIC